MDHIGDAMELLRVLRNVRRCEVRADGEKLWIVPTSNLTAEDRQQIVALKPHILAVLVEQERALKVIERTDWTDYTKRKPEAGT